MWRALRPSVHASEPGCWLAWARWFGPAPVSSALRLAIARSRSSAWPAAWRRPFAYPRGVGRPNPPRPRGSEGSERSRRAVSVSALGGSRPKTFDRERDEGPGEAGPLVAKHRPKAGRGQPTQGSPDQGARPSAW